MMKYHLLITALFLLPASSVVAADGSGTLPSAEEIVTRMGAHDLQRQVSIEGYVGMRRYVLDNHHFHKRANGNGNVAPRDAFQGKTHSRKL